MSEYQIYNLDTYLYRRGNLENLEVADVKALNYTFIKGDITDADFIF
jgi:hypothetical protein